MILLSFFFIFYGLHVSFWLGAYPTTFAFTKVLSGNVFLPAYFSTMVGIGNIVGEFDICLKECRDCYLLHSTP